MKVSSPFIKSIMNVVYQNRRPLPEQPLTVVRHEMANGKPMCEVWFMSEGCAYDREGGCTMCNYGKGRVVDTTVILESLKNAFRSLPNAYYNLVINPSGSFLDEREVCRTLRNGIYKLLDELSLESLTVESRADVINIMALNDLRKRYSSKRVSIEIGVETLNHWLLRYAVNKGVSICQIENAVNIVREAGLLSVANVGLGLPFIGEKANISQTIHSVLKALSIGFDTVIIFPYHVKPGTLLEVLFKNKRYQCSSLWSLVDVLANLPSDNLFRVNISWHRNYYTDKTKIMESPDTCPKCRNIILHLLDNYKFMPSQDTISALESFECNCRDEWRSMIEKQSSIIDLSVVESDFRFLANYFQIENNLLCEVLQELKEFPYVDC